VPWTPDPANLVCQFTVPFARTWGTTTDKDTRTAILAAAQQKGLLADSSGQAYGFVIDVAFPTMRRGWRRQEPDIENVPKLVVDAFTGYLYPDDNVNFVRAVHVHGDWSSGEPSTTVWIYRIV
jgi:hypothetical protein